MAKSDRPVALVTGASRGAGAGIARALGSYGMRVYVTGRAETVGEARGWDGAALPGTIHSTAAAVTAAGGEGIAVRCDHADDERVQEVFAQIEAESGRLDLLVNNATMIHPELITPKPFWEKPLDAAGILDVGLRSAYVASWHAARRRFRCVSRHLELSRFLYFGRLILGDYSPEKILPQRSEDGR